MSACEKCWGDAFMRMMDQPMKDQAEHYQDLLKERAENPCTTEQQNGVNKSPIEQENRRL